MKAMLAGFVAMFVITVLAWYILGQVGFGSAELYSGPAVRLD
jgi:hypothetical protein